MNYFDLAGMLTLNETAGRASTLVRPVFFLLSRHLALCPIHICFLTATEYKP
jgi:hypothetical protein